MCTGSIFKFLLSAAMHYHQLLVVLVLVHAAAAGSSPLTVNVSDKGIDDFSCLHENTTQACSSLEFVLKQLYLLPLDPMSF